MNPQIAIVRDGCSDFLVLKKFISVIFEQHHFITLKEDNFFEYENLNISNVLSTYIAKAHLENYSLFEQSAVEFRKEISSILFIAVQKFSKEKEFAFSNHDILILNGDAEKILGEKEIYFENWAYTINNIINLAIEEFYEKMVQNAYRYDQLPLILPLVLFPSSEILVASCMYDFKKDNFRKLSAKPALKQKVYETEHIHHALETGKLNEVLELFVATENLSNIYHDLPEVRKLMQILTFAPKTIK